jgi:hypothetical protein
MISTSNYEHITPIVVSPIVVSPQRIDELIYIELRLIQRKHCVVRERINTPACAILNFVGRSLDCQKRCQPTLVQSVPTPRKLLWKKFPQTPPPPIAIAPWPILNFARDIESRHCHRDVLAQYETPIRRRVPLVLEYPPWTSCSCPPLEFAPNLNVQTVH